MKPYTYFLFDWDGCLAKTLDVWLHAYKNVFAQYNLFPEDLYISQEIFGDVFGPTKLGITDIDTFNTKLYAHVDETYTQAALQDNVLEMLHMLVSMNKKIAVVTSARRSVVQSALDFHRISHLFHAILSADDVSKTKPDPEIIFAALDRLGGTTSQAVIIGDSKSDLGAAQNASIDSILYYPKQNELFYRKETLMSYNPTHVIYDFSELLIN